MVLGAILVKGFFVSIKVQFRAVVATGQQWNRAKQTDVLSSKHWRCVNGSTSVLLTSDQREQKSFSITLCRRPFLRQA